MPIDIESFEKDSEDELRSGGRTNSEEILSFLASNPEKAYTPREIHEKTSVARGSVGVVLSRLEERGLVRHKGEYWAIGDLEDVEKTVSSLSVARSATERLGSENPDEWGEGVESKTEKETE